MVETVQISLPSRAVRRRTPLSLLTSTSPGPEMPPQGLTQPHTPPLNLRVHFVRTSHARLGRNGPTWKTRLVHPRFRCRRRHLSGSPSRHQPPPPRRRHDGGSLWREGEGFLGGGDESWIDGNRPSATRGLVQEPRLPGNASEGHICSEGKRLDDNCISRAVLPGKERDGRQELSGARQWILRAAERSCCSPPQLSSTQSSTNDNSQDGKIVV